MLKKTNLKKKDTNTKLGTKKKVVRKSKTEKEQFKKYLERIEDPNYQGGSWALPENATPLEKSKYDICKKILVYKQNHNLSTEKLAKKIKLSISETEDILHGHIDYFTLDRLLDYAGKLFSPSEI